MPFAATQFALFNAASSLSIAYMQLVDGRAYGAGGLPWQSSGGWRNKPLAACRDSGGTRAAASFLTKSSISASYPNRSWVIVAGSAEWEPNRRNRIRSKVTGEGRNTDERR